MLIANPIYDTAFKRMMENEKVAKFFISTLLGETIESVEVRPQEFTHNIELLGVGIFRLDFIATIKTSEGEYKKVLIEVQKARNLIDVMRFRNYLAEQYKKKDTINNQEMVLPITTIYVLAFKLPGIEAACIKVERKYKDLVDNTYIEQKSAFVEQLTHDSFVVQAERITGRYQTRLDKLLAVFEQANFATDTHTTKDFNHTPDEEEIKLITDILHHAGTDPVERKKIENEQEAYRTLDAMFEKERRSLEEKLYEKIKEIDEKDKALQEMAAELEALKRRLGGQQQQI